MSDGKIKTKKKDKNTWSTLGGAVLGVAAVAVAVAKSLGGNNKG